MLERCDDDKTNYDEQEPRGYFVGRDYVPNVYLVWILPRAVERGDIFSYPDEKGNQTECERKGNPPALMRDDKRDARASEQEKDCRNKDDAQVGNEVVCEEIEIDK